jgi:hypothetical protein
MADLSIEYSLNTPVFLNNDIFSKKIFDLARNNNMNGGGFGLDMYNCISLLIGIVIIIIGFVLLSFKNDFVEAEAIIRTQTCDENSQNSDNSQCKINITYTVDSIQYSKIITLNKNNIQDAPTIKIYYQISNPSYIQLYNLNYSIIGIGMIIIGIFIMIFSIGGTSTGIDTGKGKTNDISGSSKSINVGTNIYSNTSNNDGFNIVYSE